jgi:formylglycine-generating enzyme required for sulfatase activity
VTARIQRGRFSDASTSAAALHRALHQWWETTWKQKRAAAETAQQRWTDQLRQFGLSYLEPASNLTQRLLDSEQLRRDGLWADSFNQLEEIQAEFESWSAELALVPPAEKGVWQNSLGMRFVDVDGLRVSIWETRVMDFARFGKETGADHRFMWVREGKAGGPTHPVVSVTRIDALRFCEWLTEREQALGILSPTQRYRLPTDVEWSRMVGLPEEPGDSFAERSLLVWDHFPWGTEPRRTTTSGNYHTWLNATKENLFAPAGPDVPMDPFHSTAPVASFPPNAFGIYDLGGNVWEMVTDGWTKDWDPELPRVIRGGGWRTMSLEHMRSTYRMIIHFDNLEIGFRCVLSDSNSPNQWSMQNQQTRDVTQENK